MLDSHKNKLKYFAAYNANALLYSEVCAVMPLLMDENYTILLNQEAKENRFLKVKTESARTRIVRELKRRLSVVDASFWHFFQERNEHEQKLALLYLVLKAYPLAFDFHFEVVLKKWRALDYNLDRFDLQMRLDEISSQDEEVAQWTESTRTKLLTFNLRLLREAGLLGKSGLKEPEEINSSFWQYFVAAGANWFLEACFLSKTERENYI